MGWSFECVSPAVVGGATGITWDGAQVLFALPAAARIMAFDPDRGSIAEFRRYSGGINGLAISASRVLYGCQSASRRIVRLEPDGSTSVLAYKLDGRLHNNPRDLEVDARGRIWFSDPHGQLRIPGPEVYPLLEHASVLRLERTPGRGWVMRRMTFDTVIPRAVLLSADERTLYVAEDAAAPSGHSELRAYPIEDDGLGPYDVLHTFGRDHRGPQRGVDGMCVDSDSNIVVCAGGCAGGPGPMIYVFSPTGRILATEPAPAAPSGCAFGGAELRSLFVTTTTGELYRVDDSGLRGLARPQSAER